MPRHSTGQEASIKRTKVADLNNLLKMYPTKINEHQITPLLSD